MGIGRLDYARRVARALLAKYRLDTPPTPVEDVIRKERLEVLRMNWGADFGLDGLCIHNRRAIAVNVDKPHVRQRFSLAHELGHYVLNHEYLKRLGPEVDIDHPAADAHRPEDDHEREANAFANELLVPRSILVRYRASPEKRLRDGAVDEDGLGFRPFAALAREMAKVKRLPRLSEAELARLFDVSKEVVVIALRTHRLL